MSRLRGEGLASDVRMLFTASTLRELAAAVRGKTEVEAPPNLIPAGCEAIRPEMLTLAPLTQSDIDRIVAGTPGGAANIQDIYPLTALQEGILFHHLMSVEGDPYVLNSLLAFERRERLEELLGALSKVIARHDILRTAVMWEGLAEPVQVVWREAPLSVEELRLDGNEAGNGSDAAERLRARFDARRVRLDVRSAPLMRCIVSHDEVRERWLLLILIHHLAIDHTALEMVVEEAEAHLLGESERLQAPQPFRKFVAQARLGVSRSEHEAYFRAMLGDVEEPQRRMG
jgi:hypothetical protein